MDADPKAYAACFPIAQYHEPLTLPLLQAEIAKKLTYSWNDPPLDPSWTKPDPTLTGKIESAQGMLTERFAFCQTMPLDEFVKVAEALRKSGYRPTRFRPYAEGKTLRVAAVWTRDGRPWRMAHDQTADEIRQTEERNRKDGYLPVDVAGYLAAGGQRASPPPASPPCGCREPDQTTMPGWSWRHPPPNSRRSQEQLKKAGLVPLTLHAWRQADDKLSYSGVWHKTATGTSDTASFQNRSLGSATLPGVVAQQSGSLIDLDLAATPRRPAPRNVPPRLCKRRKPPSRRTRMISTLGSLGRRLIQLGENQKAIDDLDAVIEKSPQIDPGLSVPCHRPRPAGSQGPGKGGSGEVRDRKPPRARNSTWRSSWRRNWVREPTRRWRELEAALKNQPQDSDLHYDAACAYALASQAVARKDQARSKSLSERALSLLRKAIENGYADYRHMQEDADLDPLRELPAFAEIMKPGHLERSYAAVWTGEFRFEASPIFGLDPDRSPPSVPGTGGARLSHGRPLGRPDFPRGTADHRLGLAPPGDHGGDQGPTGRTSGTGSSRSASHGEGEEICPCCATVPTPGCEASSSTG